MLAQTNHHTATISYVLFQKKRKIRKYLFSQRMSAFSINSEQTMKPETVYILERNAVIYLQEI